MTLTPLFSRARRALKLACGSAGGAFAGSSKGWIQVPSTTGLGGGGIAELTWFWVAVAVGCAVAIGVGEDDGDEETLIGSPFCPGCVTVGVAREVLTRSTGLLLFCPELLEPAMP
jgi:hypothetical protein